MAGRFAGTGFPALKSVLLIVQLARGPKRSNIVGTAGPFTVAGSLPRPIPSRGFKSDLEPQTQHGLIVESRGRLSKPTTAALP